MPSLVLEGGTFRPIFSAGAMDALLDLGLEFDYVIGVSAGICNGFSYVSKQKERNLEVVRQFRHDKRYMGKRHYLKERSLFGIDFIYNQIPNALIPFDYDTFMENPCQIRVGVTNVESGKCEYLDGKMTDKTNVMLQATCAIPFVFPAIKIGKNKYYDGGLSDPIPIKKAMKDGNKKHLILLTRTKEYRKELNTSTKMAAKTIRHIYPKLESVLLNRHLLYNDTVAFCDKLEAEGSAVVLRPSYELDSMEKDIEQLNKNYEAGYRLVIENQKRIRQLFDEEEE